MSANWRVSLGTALLRAAARVLDCSIEFKEAKDATPKGYVVLGTDEISLELTRSLGINPDNCTGWAMKVSPGAFVSIEVFRNGETDSLGKLKDVVERRYLTVSPPEIKPASDQHGD